MELTLTLMTKPIYKPPLIRVHRDNDDSNLIKQHPANSSIVKKEVLYVKYVNGQDVSQIIH